MGVTDNITEHSIDGISHHCVEPGVSSAGHDPRSNKTDAVQRDVQFDIVLIRPSAHKLR